MATPAEISWHYYIAFITPLAISWIYAAICRLAATFSFQAIIDSHATYLRYAITLSAAALITPASQPLRHYAIDWIIDILRHYYFHTADAIFIFAFADIADYIIDNITPHYAIIARLRHADASHFIIVAIAIFYDWWQPPRHLRHW